jgi:DNA-binding NarL/FixJ family response regulator
MRTGVVIVEDDRAVRENLVALINMDERLRLLGAFGSAESACGTCRRCNRHSR